MKSAEQEHPSSPVIERGNAALFMFAAATAVVLGCALPGRAQAQEIAQAVAGPGNIAAPALAAAGAALNPQASLALALEGAFPAPVAAPASTPPNALPLPAPDIFASPLTTPGPLRMEQAAVAPKTASPASFRELNPAGRARNLLKAVLRAAIKTGLLPASAPQAEQPRTLPGSAAGQPAALEAEASQQDARFDGAMGTPAPVEALPSPMTERLSTQALMARAQGRINDAAAASAFRPLDVPARNLLKKALRSALRAGWEPPASPGNRARRISPDELPSSATLEELSELQHSMVHRKREHPKTHYLEQDDVLALREKIDAALFALNQTAPYKDDARLQSLAHAHGNIMEAMIYLRKSLRLQGNELLLAGASIPLDGGLDILSAFINYRQHKATSALLRRTNASFERAQMRIRESIGKDGEIEFPAIWKHVLGPALKVGDLAVNGPYLSILSLAVMSKECEKAIESYFNADKAARAVIGLWLHRALQLQKTAPAKSGA